MPRRSKSNRRGLLFGLATLTIYTSCTLVSSNAINSRKRTWSKQFPHPPSNSDKTYVGTWGISTHIIRGGGQEEEKDESQGNQKDDALKSYVASVELKDELHYSNNEDSGGSDDDEDEISMLEQDDPTEDTDFESSDGGISDEEAEGTCALVKEMDDESNHADDIEMTNTYEKKKENAVGDPDGNSSDDTDDTSDLSFLSDEEELVAELVEQEVDEGMHVMMTDAVLDVEDTLDQHSSEQSTHATTDATSDDDSNKQSFDDALAQAFLPFVFMPPNDQQLQYIRDTAKDIDMDSRRRLDRRTLYRGLLLELMPHQHVSANPNSGSNKKSKTNNLISNRRYLDDNTSHTLTAILSLATQPKWRKHITIPTKSSKKQERSSNSKSNTKSCVGSNDETWWWKGGLRLYADQNDLDQLNSASNTNVNANLQNNFFSTGQEDEGNDNSAENLEEQIALTLPMQETIAMSLAHSLGCGMFILDDETFASVRENIITNNPHLELSEDSPDLKPARLLSHLLRLANSGQLIKYTTNSNVHTFPCAKISARMERDFELQLDDIADEIANESMQRQQQDEEMFEKLQNEDLMSASRPVSQHLPLVLFLNTDLASSLLKSKSAVERLAKESQNEDNIHLLMLGKGTNPLSDKPRRSSHSSSQSNNRQSMKGGPSHSQWGDNNPFIMNNPSNMNMNLPFSPGEQNGAFPNMNMPPGSNPYSFGPNNNASGVHDPEGSRRFNIFLGRTQDKDGNPGIMGAIAPPQAGNLFPHMFAMQQRQNAAAAREEGFDSAKMNENMNKWNKFFQEQMSMSNGAQLPSPQFFNASVASPFGLGEIPEFMKSMNNSNENNQFPSPLPEIMKRVIQQAMTTVIDRLASENSEENTKLPPHLAKAFAEVLSNENLRRGIAENLARAAPALVDPRCQGVMLSVYVPPPNNHPNRGMMPGGSPPGQQQQDQSSSASTPHIDESVKDGNVSSMSGKGGPNVGSWLNKILQQNTSSSKNVGEEIDQPAEATSESIAEDTSSEEKQESDTTTTEKEISAKKARRRNRQEAIRSLAAAASVLQANKGSTSSSELKQQRGLLRLQSLCKNVPIRTPTDPVRARGWEGWKQREKGSLFFRKNRKALLKELNQRKLKLKMEGAKGAKIAIIRQMLSVRDVSDEITDVVKAAVEIEAARSQRMQESPWHDTVITVSKSNSMDDTSETDELPEQSDNCVDIDDSDNEREDVKIQFIHPSSIESALSSICRVSPSGAGSLKEANTAKPAQMAAHRSREDIVALAQDKHERALVSQVVSPQDIGVNYDMIGGLSDVKELLRQSITYPLKFPHLYSEGIAREAVKGVLLFGPPGTGKTMLAKAVATEGCASFLSVDASSVENKWLGESEKNAKAVFTLARRLAPCVIFLDEVDSLLSSREGSSDDSAHGTLTSVKTTMMSEWDGLNSGTNGKGEAGSNRVVVIGSTNRPFDLDEAVLRRFPRRILVDLPDLETRKEILEVTLSENRLDPSVNFTLIAEKLEGYTGSDIKEVCREAVVQISHEQARMLDQGIQIEDDWNESDSLESDEGSNISSLQRLRPVRMKDFENALSKLKRSVSEKGRELARVWEWNDEYGEIKKKNKKDGMAQMMNMFL